MRFLVLTVDYEIFGNGTGDVQQHVTGPAESMARVMEKFGVPLTIFVEMEELVAFERNSSAARQHYGYDPASLIRRQIRDLVRRGHDAQLHLHPQWHDCEWKDNRWDLHFEKATIDSLFPDQSAVGQYIADRKARLEEMVAEPGRKVTSYRAGGFAAQPANMLLPALVDNNFAIESSVVCGMQQQERFHQIDYRCAPRQHRCWRFCEDVSIPDRAGTITEIPIHSVMGRRFHQLSIPLLRAKFAGHVPKRRQNEMLEDLGVSRRDPLGLLKFLWKPVPLKLDFHNFTPRRLMHWIHSAPAPHPDDPLDVFVAIGHTKEHINNASFESFIRLATADPNLKIISFHEAARLLREHRILHSRASDSLPSAVPVAEST